MEQQGIWKPRQARWILSLRTAAPDSRRRIHRDQIDVHERIRSGALDVPYSFTGTDPDHRMNRQLTDTLGARAPIIYWLALKPGRYIAALPAFIVAADLAALECRLAFGVPERDPDAPFPDLHERREGMRIVRERLLAAERMLNQG